MRGAFPGDGEPGHDPIGHLELAANCDAFLVAPASANTVAKLAAGHRRLDADHLLPRLHGAAPGRAGDERPHVRRRRDPGQPGDAARARGRGDRARGGQARLARRARPRPPARPARACWPGSRRRCRPASGPGTACGCWSPPAAPASRSTRSASSATAPAAAWASPSPPPPRRRGAEVTLIAANVALPEPAGRPPHRRRDRRRSWPRRRRASSPTAHVLLMAAAPADFRAAEPPPGRSSARARLDLHLEPTEDILAALAAHAPRGQTVVGFAAEHGGERSPAPAPSSTRKGADLIVLNDVSDPEIGFESDRQRRHPDRRRRRDRRPNRLQGRDRRRDPRQGRPARSSEPLPVVTQAAAERKPPSPG